jgi:hypothetical protein
MFSCDDTTFSHFSCDDTIFSHFSVMTQHSSLFPVMTPLFHTFSRGDTTFSQLFPALSCREEVGESVSIIETRDSSREKLEKIVSSRVKVGKRGVTAKAENSSCGKVRKVVSSQTRKIHCCPDRRDRLSMAGHNLERDLQYHSSLGRDQ